MAKGCDYSWDRPDLGCLKNQGVGFVVRYGSRDPSKNLSPGELDSILGYGLDVAVVWQEGKTQMLRGYAGGQADARDAKALFDGLGLYEIPIHYSCDQDIKVCNSSELAAIDAYNEGTISVTGLARNGGYGGYAYIKRQFDRNKLRWGWQTYAWSLGTDGKTQWDSRAQLRQTQNNVSVCGGLIDWDESRAEDFGQWPRPLGTGEEDMTPAVTYSPAGQCRAFVGADKNIYYAGPETDWGWLTIGATARSGVDLVVAPSGDTIISYINNAGHYCLYTRKHGSADWTWSDCGGQA